MADIRAERAYVADITGTAMVVKLYRGSTIEIPIRPEWKKWQALVVYLEPGRIKPIEIMTLGEYTLSLRAKDLFESDTPEEECALTPTGDEKAWWPSPLVFSWFTYLGEEECALTPPSDELPEW